MNGCCARGRVAPRVWQLSAALGPQWTPSAPVRLVTPLQRFLSGVCQLSGYHLENDTQATSMGIHVDASGPLW